jgi:hypothetical protein
MTCDELADFRRIGALTDLAASVGHRLLIVVGCHSRTQRRRSVVRRASAVVVRLGFLVGRKRARMLRRAAAVSEAAYGKAPEFTGDSLAYFQSIYRDPTKPEELRLAAARAAASLERPALSATHARGDRESDGRTQGGPLACGGGAAAGRGTPASCDAGQSKEIAYAAARRSMLADVAFY